MDIQKLLAVARGEDPADLVLMNAGIVNTFTGEIEKNSVAISQGVIAGIGEYRDAQEMIDLTDRYVSPGFIDGHIHLESSHLSPTEYARAVVPRGVLGVVTDFHEIANVSGLAGIKYILSCAQSLPLDIFGMAPSCVPSTHLETAGSRLDAKDLQVLRNMKEIIGLGEMMNFPGVISGDPDVWAKINLFQGGIIDGHSPGLFGKNLNAYLAAGILSDHECTTLEEAAEKLRRGMHIMIREGSSEKNLETLLPLVTDETFKRCFFVVDDRDCGELLLDGDVDAVVRQAIRWGLKPVRAIQMATINPAEYFSLKGLGAVAPGYRANLIVFDDLSNPNAEMVFYEGKLVAREGELLLPLPLMKDDQLMHTMKIKPFAVESLRIPARTATAPVIEIIPGQIVTKRIEANVSIQDGFVQADISTDILKLAVVERHEATGNIGLGLVKGFGLKRGALASSIAHDSHNVVVVGTNDRDMYEAVKELERLQGGLVVISDGEILASLALPIAGLLSEEPLQVVVQKMVKVKEAAASLGCVLDAPFGTLSFLALPVIPELKLTDMGLVDVLAFKLLGEAG